MPRLFTLLCAIALSLSMAAQEPNRPKYNLDYADTVRTYSMYLPQNLATGAPLVVYVHGWGSTTRWRPDLNAAADRYGFAVCYPDGTPDSYGKDSWNVGYSSQASMQIDEAHFFRTLLDEVSARFNLSRENVFCAGFSNGGDLCYQFAYTEPDLFRAYASVAGLTFECTYLAHKLTTPVLFLEIHGNTDTISMWQGDHENTGGWGPYIPVPLAVAAIAYNNRCTQLTTDTIASKSDSTRVITRHAYTGAPSGMDVILYEIDGGNHSWADQYLDTADLIWRFFAPHLKN